MRTKVTLVLIFLNVALFFFIFWLREGPDELKKPTGVLGPEVVSIQSLTIHYAQRPDPVKLERRGESWHLTAPVDWPANPFAVSRILNELQQLRPVNSFAVKDLAKSQQSLADFGLETPPLVLTFTAGQIAPGTDPRSVTLRIGETAKLGNHLYVLSPDGETVHVVNRSLAESLAVKLESLRADTLFSIAVFETQSLNVQTNASANMKVRIARNDSRWLFESPITTRANKTKADLVVNQLNSLRLVEFVDARTNDATGLAPDEVTMRVTLEGNNRRETLILGARLKDVPASVAAARRAAEEAAPPEPAVGAPEKLPEVEYFYGKMEDKTPVFVVGVPSGLLNELHNAQVNLRERQILDVDPSTITSITLSDPNRADVTLQRLEPSGTDLVGGWQIVQRNGERSLANRPADREVVQRLIQHLCSLTAEEFTSDAPTETILEEKGFSRPARTVRLAVAAAPTHAPTQPTHAVTLQFGIGTDRHVYAKLDTPPYVYRVDEEILNRTPVTPLAYRDRVVRQLPEGATITGLKLVETSSETVLLETVLPLPPGDPVAVGAPAPLPRTVVESFASELRTLRAKRFVQESFAKTVVVTGEDRPWKYQLTCTISLVGGAGAQTETFNLFFSERAGGTTQFVGIPDPEYDVVFEAEQPLVDALYAVVYGPRDPGPPPPQESTPPAPEPAAK